MVESSKNIELIGTNGRLIISPDAQGWSSVVLYHQNREVALGSEKFQYIIDHLSTFLSEEKFINLEWVLSLSELHFSFYGKRKKEEALLKIQDHKAQWIIDLKLTDEQQKEWKSILSKFGRHNK